MFELLEKYPNKKIILTNADVIYFEYNPDAVKSAESIGITSYFYDADKKDLDRLETFLDKNS